jgi:hypothetical protein
MGPVGVVLFCAGLWTTLGAIVFETGRQVTATAAAVLVIVGLAALWQGAYPGE